MEKDEENNKEFMRRLRKRLDKPLVEGGRTTKSKGGKLKVNIHQGIRGLLR